MMKIATAIAALLFICQWANAKDLDSADTSASMINLHMKDQPVSKVLGAINEQTGMKLIWDAAKPEPNVSVDADNLPFWDVMIQLGKQATFYTAPMLDGSVRLSKPEQWRTTIWPGVAAKTYGAILVTPTRVDHLLETPAASGKQDFAQLALFLQPEPRLAVIAYEAAVVPTQAVDENGASLVPASALHDPRPGDSFPTQGTFPEKVPLAQDDSKEVRVNVQLQTSKTTGRRIANIKGVVPIWIATSWATVEIPDAVNAAKSTHDLAGMKLTVDKMSQKNKEVVMSFVYDHADLSPEDWTKITSTIGAAKMNLLDAGGKPCLGGSRSFGGTDKMYHVTHYFTLPDGAAGQGPFKLVIEVPTETRQFDVPFEFSDLPLP